MNDMHDVYLRNGEITYVGRVDSIKAYGGRERVLLEYWLTDPRVKELHILWNQKRDSIVVSVPAHDPENALEVMIGNGNGVISEGDHTFFIYSYDGKGHRSVVFESLISVYGERYQASLINRPLRKIDVTEDSLLVIEWGGSVSRDELGLLISYFDRDNELVESIIPTDSLKDPVVFKDIDITKEISYKTMYIPEEFAIDTFYTKTAEQIKVRLSKNVALNKNATVSDVLNSSFPGSKAVDGIITSDSRWVSSTTGEHWIEVDLGQPYPIQSFKTYNGSGSTPNMAISNFMFQAHVDNEWVTLVEVSGNTNPSFGATFEEVVTDKVRLFVPNYANNQVRLFELEVYSIQTLN
jgi:hypothetical protein